MEFSRQEYWSGLPFPSPGDLPDTGIEPGSPTLQADALPSEPFLQFLRAVFTFAGYKIHFYIPFQHFEDIIPLSSDPHSL